MIIISRIGFRYKRKHLNYLAMLVKENFIEEFGVNWIVNWMEKNGEGLGPERMFFIHAFMHSL